MGLGVGAYEISESGALTQLSRSPFPFPSERPAEIEISPDGRMLYVLDLDRGLAAFEREPSGALELVAGSPVAIGEFSHTLELAAGGLHAYAGMPFGPAIAAFELSPGALPSEVPGSPFPAQPSVAELLAPEGTPLLYQITRENRNIQTFTISGSGELTALGSPVPVTDRWGRVPNGGAFHRSGTEEPIGRIYCLVATYDSLPEGPTFRRGDVDASERFNLSDPVFLLNHLFRGGEAPSCLDAGDSNDDGRLDIADAVHSLTFLFLGGDPPKSPFPDCGFDPPDDDELIVDPLPCDEYPTCR
jgi:hypothetical protein